MLIKGNACFEAGAPAFQDADLIIRLEDTSFADTPASLVAQIVLHGISWSGDPAQRQPFTLNIPDNLDPRSRYELRMHLDKGRNGHISRGDFITTQSHRLDTTVLGAQINIPLSWLRPE